MLGNANIDRWLEKLTKLAIHRTQGLNRRQQTSRGRGRLPPFRGDFEQPVLVHPPRQLRRQAQLLLRRQAGQVFE